LKKSTRKILRDYGGTILVAAIFAFIIRNYFIEAYRIPSSAMKPTLISGDTVFAAKWPFWVQDNYIPERGEVVIYSGTDSTGNFNTDYVRRVIGLPGDEIALQNGSIILNGKKLASPPPGPLKATEGTPAEDCLKETMPQGKNYAVCRETPVLEDFAPQKIPPGSMFVLGDFRTTVAGKKKVRDIVPLSSLKAKVTWIWLSIEPTTGLIPQFRLQRMFQRIQ
jgi:signal peptidase I